MKATTAARKLGDVLESNQDEDGKPISFTSETLKKHFDKCVSTKQKMHDANSDYKSALDAAEKNGIPKTELKDVIKIKTKPKGEDRKATVNVMLEMLGGQPEFDFGDKKKH